MDASDRHRAYDRGSTIFSPNGRLYQVEYAREAVAQGSPSVGVRTADGIVLAALRSIRGPLAVADSVEKLHEIDTHLGIATAGHAADARQLVDFARRRAQTDRLRYTEPMGVDPLAKALTDHMQEYTQTGGTRPFGTALLIGGVTDGEARLYEADPGGAIFEWQATAIGADGDRIRSHLESGYESGQPIPDGVDLALSALAREEPRSPEEVTVARIREDGFSRDSPADRRAALDRLDLLADGAAS